MKRILAPLILSIVVQTAANAAATQDRPQSATVTFASQVTQPSGSQAPGEQYIFFGANPKPGDKESDNPEMNLFKLTDFPADCPCERSFFVSEKFAFQEVLG